MSILLSSGCQIIPINHKNQNNICRFLEDNPYMNQVISSENISNAQQATILAIIHHESAHQPQARPVKKWIIKPWIPWSYYSSAKSYAQITQPTWQDFSKTRTFKPNINAYMDNISFIIWYFDKNKKVLGTKKDTISECYLIYHEGPSGYRKGTQSFSLALKQYALKVEHTGKIYLKALKKCQASRYWQQQWVPF